jgi:CorA-like Mg2+ transporter protein
MAARLARIDLVDLGPGVAWAFEFDENGRGRPLSGDSSIDLTSGRRFVWVHLILGNARTREWIGAQDALPPEAREVFLSKDRHPSLHWGGEALWGTPHDLRHEDQTAGMDATDLRFALWPQFLLTARHHPARSAIAVKDQAEKGATKPRRKRPSGVSRLGLQGAATGRLFPRRSPSAGGARAASAGGDGGSAGDGDQPQSLRAHRRYDSAVAAGIRDRVFRHEYEGPAVRRFRLWNGLRRCLLPAGGSSRLSLDPPL